MSIILVTGGASGLGKELTDTLRRNGHTVTPYDHKYGQDVLDPPKSMDEWRKLLRPYDGPEAEPILDVLINCAGRNGINWLPDVTDEQWDEIMDTNAKGIFKMTQAALPLLKQSRGTVLNIVSNAARMPMRCSAAYNASKGAALILTQQLARELAADNITVFSVSPNKLAGTAMSEQIDDEVIRTRGWTREQAVQYQLQGLLTGEETPPSVVAEFISFLLSRKDRHKYLSGCDIHYGA